QPRSSSPQQDSFGGTTNTKGEVDIKKWKEVAEAWGKLPEKERAKAMLELTRDMPPKHRELIETYFKKLAQADSGKYSPTRCGRVSRPGHSHRDPEVLTAFQGESTDEPAEWAFLGAGPGNCCPVRWYGSC